MSLDVHASRVQAAKQSPQAPLDPAENAAPRQELVDAFQEALRGGEGGTGGGKKRAGQEAAGGQAGKAETGIAGHETEQSRTLSAASLMESLFGNRMQPLGTREAVGAAKTSAAASARAAETAALADKLADRILVSEPGKGVSEVRISLSDKALRGTEVTLSRAPDGQLAVTLSTTDSQSFQTLVAAQDSLRAALERQGENVRVDVTRNAGADAEQNDAQRRSRGYQNYQPDEER